MVKANPTVKQIERNGAYVTQFWLYDTLIAEFTPEGLVLGSYHDFSATTTKHLNKFSNTTKPERLAGIKSGEIRLVESTRSTENLV